MRRTFAQILQEAKIDPKQEYKKLYGMLFDRTIVVSNSNRVSAYDELSECFLSFPFRGTCLSLEEFNELNDFHFEKEPTNFKIDELILLCEYMENLLIAYQGIQLSFPYGYGNMRPQFINVQFYLQQIGQVIERIGYMQATQNGFTIFVEKSPAAIAVAESDLVPKELSYRIISYNHYSMKGQLEAKKSALVQLASLLEPKRGSLKKADKTLESDLFYLFNNLNIRHNNVDPADSAKYKPFIVQMKQEELEHWYDETYQMCLLAFLQLEQSERKIEYDRLKTAIEGQK
mgnify:CR=1 FL=1